MFVIINGAPNKIAISAKFLLKVKPTVLKVKTTRPIPKMAEDMSVLYSTPRICISIKTTKYMFNDSCMRSLPALIRTKRYGLCCALIKVNGISIKDWMKKIANIS